MAPINFAKRTIIVQGTQVDVDTNNELRIVDLTEGMSKVASQMAWWASVKAAAVEEAEIVDAKYRQWRAKKTKELPPNLAEWKIKAAIEADPEFEKHKREVARTKANVELAIGMFESFSKKGNILQSRGAMDREERSKMGLTTPIAPRPARSEPAISATEAIPTKAAAMASPHKSKLG